MNNAEFRLGNHLQTNKGDLLIVDEIAKNKIYFFVADRSKYPLPYKWKAELI